MKRNLPVGALLAGALGGGFVVLLCLVAIAIAGGLESSSGKVVTVQETPILSGPASGTGSLSARAVYARDALGVVLVNASGVTVPQSAGEILRGEGGGQGTASGSGFEIDGEGTILTNWHVVEGAQKVTVGFGHSRVVAAKVIGKDPAHDLAVLRIAVNGLVLHPLQLGDSSSVQVGDPVFAIGNPFGLGRTLTAGVVSALGRKIQAPDGLTIDGSLQTDASINPGNSGGPLLDDRGRVVGINSQIETSGADGGSVGIAFAIPIDIAKSELRTLAKSR